MKMVTPFNRLDSKCLLQKGPYQNWFSFMHCQDESTLSERREQIDQTKNLDHVLIFVIILGEP